MAGYSDTRQLIIDTLMGRPAGTEIQPEDHQAFALALNDYIRNVELNSGNAFIGFAQADTVPIQSDNGQCFYISTVPPSTNIVYANFIDSEGNPISVTTPSGKMAFVTLIWNTRNWDAQITIIETNWSQVLEDNIASGAVTGPKIAPNSISTSKIIDGTIQSTDLNPNAFDNTLTTPGKIAPADVVGSKLTELESKVDEIIMDDVPFTFEGYIVNNQTGKTPGSFVNSSGYKSTDFTNVENADRIVAKLKQVNSVVALIAYYDVDKVFISALAKEYQGNTEIIVNKSEFPSGTKYVRLCTQTSGAYPKYAHLYLTSVIEIINSQIDDTLTKEGKIADSKTVGDRFAMVELNNSIFKTVPINHTLPLDMLIDFGVQGRLSGRLYWIQVKRQETKQNLTIHFTTTDNPRTITGSQNFKNNNIIDSGICKYTETDTDNETLSVIIDWSKISVGDTFNYYPDEYVVKDSVFNGGLLSWNIIPIQDKTITSEKLTDDAFDSTLTKQGKIADAKAVGDVLREAGTLTEEMQGVFPVNTYGERYWAVCGDSITSANHAKNGVFLIDGISDDDPYCPIDGYSKLNSYKRKNYAYYFAKEHTIKWANYGYGGTTLSHCPSIGHPVSQTIPFVDDRIKNLKAGIDWDFITIFFGYNDFIIGPIAEREKWLKSQYGTDIRYPENAAQIGQEGFATAEQKEACDAVTGTVGEITYNDNNAYFFAKFFGLIDDSTKETFLGAYNYALEYLIRKYTKAKIMIVAPFFSKYKELFTKGIHAMADKWGVTCFDFTDVPFWYMNPAHEQMPFLNDAEGSGGYWYTETGVGLPRTLDGYNMSRYSTDSLHPTNLGYKMLAEMFGNKMLNG